MRPPTHAVIGLAIADPFAAAELHRSPIAGGILVVAGVMAATAPDLDLRFGLPHRGITHSLQAATVVGLLVLMAGTWVHFAAAPLVALVVFLAWISHIAADLTNRMPVAVLWPLKWGPFWWGVPQASLFSVVEETTVWVLVLLLLTVEAGHFSGFIRPIA